MTINEQKRFAFGCAVHDENQYEKVRDFMEELCIEGYLTYPTFERWRTVRDRTPQDNEYLNRKTRELYFQLLKKAANSLHEDYKFSRELTLLAVNVLDKLHEFPANEGQ